MVSVFMGGRRETFSYWKNKLECLVFSGSYGGKWADARGLSTGETVTACCGGPQICTREHEKKPLEAVKTSNPKTHDPGAQECRLFAYFTADDPHQVGS